jgi:hypothetical protein
MCYRCGVCNYAIAPGLPMLKHTIYRTVPKIIRSGKNQDGSVSYSFKDTRQEVEREVPICRNCAAAIALGVPFAQLCKQHGLAIRLGDAAERARRLTVEARRVAPASKDSPRIGVPASPARIPPRRNT